MAPQHMVLPTVEGTIEESWPEQPSLENLFDLLPDLPNSEGAELKRFDFQEEKDLEDLEYVSEYLDRYRQILRENGVMYTPEDLYVALISSHVVGTPFTIGKLSVFSMFRYMEREFPEEDEKDSSWGRALSHAVLDKHMKEYDKISSRIKLKEFYVTTATYLSGTALPTLVGKLIEVDPKLKDVLPRVVEVDGKMILPSQTLILAQIDDGLRDILEAEDPLTVEEAWSEVFRKISRVLSITNRDARMLIANINTHGLPAVDSLAYAIRLLNDLEPIKVAQRDSERGTLGTLMELPLSERERVMNAMVIRQEIVDHIVRYEPTPYDFSNVEILSNVDSVPARALGYEHQEAEALRKRVGIIVKHTLHRLRYKRVHQELLVSMKENPELMPGV